MVVALAQGELLVLRCDTSADRGRLAEIHGCAGDIGQLAGGNEARSNGRGLVGSDGQLLVQDGVGGVAAEIEVRVIGRVEDGGLVGRAAIVDAQAVVLGQGVGHSQGDGAGIAILAILADVGELNPRAVLALDRLAPPQLLVEAVGATMEMVGPVVQVELVALAIELELAGGDAVAVAADDGAEEILVLGVAGEIVVAEDDITRVALPIGHGQ